MRWVDLMAIYSDVLTVHWKDVRLVACLVDQSALHLVGLMVDRRAACSADQQVAKTAVRREKYLVARWAFLTAQW